MVNAEKILLTGNPGVGKTTLICKLCDMLKNKNISIKGFYTKEVRNTSQSRIGFDVITIDGKIGRLARSKDLLGKNETTKHFVGNYAVFINEFESLVLPLLKEIKNDTIYVIDEIGKMELFSYAFQEAVRNLFLRNDVKILATIPISRGKPIVLVDKLRNEASHVVDVFKSNRDNLPNEILSLLKIE